MKIKTLLQTLVLCSVFSFSANAQCSISNLIIEASGCDADGFVTIDIEFDVENPGADNMFTITGNGTDYGQFEYGEDFYTIGPVEGDCATTYEVVITDVNDNNCTESIAFGLPFCCGGCDYLIVDYVGTNNCTGSGTFFMDILIDHPTSESFEVYIDGIDFGTYEYGEEVYTFGPFTGDCTTTRYVSVQDASIFCEADLELEPVCCPEYCSISDITVEAIECTDENQFSIELNFDFAEVEEDNFDFWANGFYHNTYAYADLPILIEDFPQDPNGNNFVTIFGIGEDQLCADDLAFDGLECASLDCTISDVYAEAYVCNDQGQVFVDVEFDIAFAGPSNQFTITGNGTTYGTFSYGQNFYTVGPFTPDCDVEYEFIVTDVDESDCSDFYVFTDALCCESNDCSITGGEAEALCTDDGLFADVWFEYDNPGPSNQFLINVWGEDFGPFEYGESFYNIGPLELNCEPFQPITITDVDNSDCSVFFELELIDQFCCDEFNCSINNLTAEAYDCNDDGEIYFDISFDVENSGAENFFTVTGNGNDYGSFEYGEDFYTVGPFNSDCSTAVELIITDVNYDDCFAIVEFDEIFCCEEEECAVTSVTVETTECNNGTNISVWYEIEGGSGEIYIITNDDYWGPYDDDGVLPLTFVSQLYPTEFLTVSVCDNEYTDCCTTVEVINPCYDGTEPCEMTTLDFGPNPICEDGNIITEWFIDGNNVSEVGYDIYVNNLFQTFVEWNDSSWYDFDLEAPETELFTIKVCDNDNVDCCIEWELENPCFEEDTPEECSITDVEAEAFCTEDGLFADVWFTADNTGSSDQFNILVNGEQFGPFTYSQDFYTVGPMEFACDESQFIDVTDVDNPNCTGFFNLELEEDFCCDEEEELCIIHTLDFGDDPTCVDSFIVTQWLIDGDNLSEVGFDIFIDNIFHSFVTYNDSSWYDFDIDAPNTEFFTLKICDNDNEDCCIEWELENPCFEEETPEECFIDNVTVNNTNCIGGEVSFTLDFDYGAGNSAEFNLSGNGEDYGIFSYDSLPVTLTGFEGDGITSYEFIISDTQDENCAAEIVAGSIDCSPAELVDYGETQTSLMGLIEDVELRSMRDIKSIRLFDIRGNEIRVEKNISEIIQLDSSVSAGILILRIETSKEVIIKKIVRVN